jgi:carbamoyltransferase
MAAILGLNAYHGDSAACLIVDGKLVAAAQEDRFRRINHWVGLPTNAIDYCLREARLMLRDVDHIAVNHKPGVHKWRRLGFVLTHPKLIWRKTQTNAASIGGALEKTYRQELNAKIHYVEHHLAHLTSAFFASHFEEAACLSVDGFGDFASAAMGFGRSENIKIDNCVHFPHSLGIFYSALTQFLGFTEYGDEDKVMSLAPSGEPNYLDQLRDVVRIRSDGTFRLNLKYFRHHIGDVSHNSTDCAPELETLYRKELVDLLGKPRKAGEPLEKKHKDLARSVQTMYEKVFFALLGALHKQHPSDYLALAGGCALNSVGNGKVYRRTPFKRMYVPSAAGNAGGAVGAAAFVYSQMTNRDSRFVSATPYLGPESSEQEIHALLDWKKKEIGEVGCSAAFIGVEEDLLRRTAQAIADGKIVGWFQGRLEWGQHPLGNRSILADPRRTDVKDILDAKIKRLESYRPFAASILRESVSEWFDQEDDVPFMTHVFQIRSQKQSFIPAVMHVDGSARLHTVEKETNPRYHRLIEHFREITGIPVVLNTAFRLEDPVVCYPEEALDFFLSTEIDLLVLGNFWIERTPGMFLGGS